MGDKFPMVVYLADGMAVRFWFVSEASRIKAYQQMQLIMSGNAFLSDDEGFHFTCKIDNLSAVSIPVDGHESSIDEKELMN